MLFVPKKEQVISAIKFIGEFDPLFDAINVRKIPYEYNTQVCPNCGQSLERHVMYNENIICPDQYIIYDNNMIVNVMSIENFEEIYKPLLENE